MPEHSAARPTWDCRVCADPWPCAPARLALRAELGETQLRIYGWTVLEEAVGDLPQLTAPQLFRRFLLWTRSPSSP
jgi:hypothetical protein